MSRYLVIGPSGSGKSTLAEAIAARLSISFYATDSLYWSADWVLASDEEVVSRIPLDEASWVLDNNFTSHHHCVWMLADTIVWLNYPFWLVFRRLLMRNIKWCFLTRSHWTGTSMKFGRAVSGIRHLFRQYRQQVAFFPEMLGESKCREVLIFHHPNDCISWLAKLEHKRK